MVRLENSKKEEITTFYCKGEEKPLWRRQNLPSASSEKHVNLQWAGGRGGSAGKLGKNGWRKGLSSSGTENELIETQKTLESWVHDPWLHHPILPDLTPLCLPPLALGLALAGLMFCQRRKKGPVVSRRLLLCLMLHNAMLMPAQGFVSQLPPAVGRKNLLM